MCAPNKTKKGKKAFSYLFRTHLSITISADWLLGHHVKNGSLNCMLTDSIIEVFYHQTKMLIATKHIADNNFVFR